jgi:hypothetical protein
MEGGMIGPGSPPEAVRPPAERADKGRCEPHEPLHDAGAVDQLADEDERRDRKKADIVARDEELERIGAEQDEGVRLDDEDECGHAQDRPDKTDDEGGRRHALALARLEFLRKRAPVDRAGILGKVRQRMDAHGEGEPRHDQVEPERRPAQDRRDIGVDEVAVHAWNSSASRPAPASPAGSNQRHHPEHPVTGLEQVGRAFSEKELMMASSSMASPSTCPSASASSIAGSGIGAGAAPHISTKRRIAGAGAMRMRWPLSAAAEPMGLRIAICRMPIIA